MTVKHGSSSRLWRGTVEAFVLRAAGIGLLFLMHSVLGRLIGPEGYGSFSYALALAGLLSVVVPLGWPTALMRFIAQYVEHQRWGLLHGAILRAHQITFIFSGLVALALWTITYWKDFTPSMVTSLRFAAVLLPLLAFVALRRKAFQGLERVKASIIPEDIILPLLVVGGATAFAVTTASQALLVYFAAAFLVFLLGSVWLWYSLPVEGRSAPLELKTREWMAIALPMVFGGISQMIIKRTDVLMLGAMVDLETVGIYTAANRIAMLITFVLGSVNIIAAPMLAAAYHGARHEQFKTIIRKAMLWSTIGGLPLFGVMILWPQWLLSFFGPQFVQGKLLLQVLAIGQLFNAATGPVGFAMLMTGMERTFAWTTGIVSMGNVLGNLVAIPIWGALGAAMVAAISIAVLNISLLIFVTMRRIVAKHEHSQ